jgi:uncharacterized protein
VKPLSTHAVAVVQRARVVLRWLESATRGLLLALVHIYRLFFRAWLGNRCRYAPSCSAYAVQALQKHGAWTGGALAASRLLRCHPWCEGGEDPVPEQIRNPIAGLFTRLLQREAPLQNKTDDTPCGATGPRFRKHP